MNSFFQQITQDFKNLTIGDQPDRTITSNQSGPEELDNSRRQCSLFNEESGCYKPQPREFVFVPTTNDPMRPNFVQTGLCSYWIGRYYPTGTSAQTWAIDDLKELETSGHLRRQVTIGRWIAVCDSCLLDCAEGQWEKTCEINMQTKKLTSAVQFWGRCKECGRTFEEFVQGI